MSYRFPLATTTWDHEEREAINKVLDSGNLTMGENVKEYEHAFAQYIGSKYCVMVNSGSSANLLMVYSLLFTHNKDFEIHPGDEVIVPAVSWPTTYYPISQCGLKMKFVDIDLRTLNYDLDHLESAVSDKTRIIFAVNLLGNPNNFLRINEIIGDRPILILEDNCESLGAVYENKKTGNWGLMGSYSSYFSHHISTMEGGMITTNDEELYKILLCLRAHGWTRNLPEYNLICGHKKPSLFDESFRFVLPGFNLRPLEISGAIGLCQIKKLPYLIEQRRKNGSLFKAEMRDHPVIQIQDEIGESSWFGFSLVIRPGLKIERSDLLNKLENAGIECRPIVAGNFARKEVAKYLEHTIFGDLPNADHMDTMGLFIGNHHYPIPDVIEKVSGFYKDQL